MGLWVVVDVLFVPGFFFGGFYGLWGCVFWVCFFVGFVGFHLTNYDYMK